MADLDTVPPASETEGDESYCSEYYDESSGSDGEDSTFSRHYAPKQRRKETTLESACEETERLIKDLEESIYSDKNKSAGDKSIRYPFLRMKTSWRQAKDGFRILNHKLSQATAEIAELKESNKVAAEEATKTDRASRRELKVLRRRHKADSTAMKATIEDVEGKLQTAQEDKTRIEQEAKTKVAELKATNDNLEDRLKTSGENKVRMEGVIVGLKDEKTRLEGEKLALEDAKNTMQDGFVNFAKTFVSPESIQKLAPQKEEPLCVICQDAKATHLINPCGHQCLCANGNCQGALLSLHHPTCPICRTAIVSTTRVYT